MNSTFQKGDAVRFTVHILAHLTKEVIIPKDAICIVTHKTTKHIFVIYKNKEHCLRYMPERMKRVKSKLGKVLYA